MQRSSVGIAFVSICLVAPGASGQEGARYPWPHASGPADALAARLAPPPGFEREPLAPGSFGAWLRQVPLKPGRPVLRLFDGSPKSRQDVHVAVIDIDAGTRDLQQCADAVLRLRAEWLLASGRPDAIRFRFTSGHEFPWSRWAAGERPQVRGAQVRWSSGARADASHASFRNYLDTLFTYAGTLSLERETVAVPLSEMRVGDVFVQGGSPGHAVIVVDMARQLSSGRRVFMIAHSYMPAQEIHVLSNPERTPLEAWYALDFGDTLATPEWTFERRHLRRFRD
jgi:hypothetical protein